MYPPLETHSFSFFFKEIIWFNLIIFPGLSTLASSTKTLPLIIKETAFCLEETNFISTRRTSSRLFLNLLVKTMFSNIRIYFFLDMIKLVKSIRFFALLPNFSRIFKDFFINSSDFFFAFSFPNKDIKVSLPLTKSF